MPENTMNNHRNKIIRCNSSNSRNWADLPKELLEIIGEHLNSRIDVFRYRAVCSSWRSAIILSASSLIKASIYHVIICRLELNCHTCLVKLVETIDGGFEVSNPLTIPKPDLNLGKSFNSLDCRLIELAQGLHFDSSIDFDYGELNVRKAVLFRGCGILAIFDVNKLGFRVFGEDNWTNLGNSSKLLFEDILVCQGEYYVMDVYGNVYWIDRFMNIVKYLPRLNSSGQQKNLVESEGQLYVVDTYTRLSTSFNEKVDMKVYKLDEKWGIWVQVTSLNDRVFVLGKDVCFSVSVNDFPGCEGNCIYFIDRYNDERMKCSLTDCCRHNRLFMRGATCSPRRYYDAKIGYYVLCVFKLEDRSIRDVEGSPSLKLLFSPPKGCFNSTLSFP